MARIQELLAGQDARIDYPNVIARWPWIVERGHKCILSPDSDGLLCGLFMNNILGWEIKGFYDGKGMRLDESVSARDCVFLDMEIFRDTVRSVGHHMVLYNSNNPPDSWANFGSCIQANNLRDYNGLHTFRLKYPLATIHLLVGIVGSRLKMKLPESAICTLLFTDGVYKNLFSYPENILNWLAYLRADETSSALKAVFANDIYSVMALMQAMDEFFRRRDEITIKGERGDRLRISTNAGTPFNVISNGGTSSIDPDAVARIEQFIGILAELTGWNYRKDAWRWRNLRLRQFTKRSLEQDKLNVNGDNFNAMIRKKPLSWAMTSNTNIEYTLDQPDTLD